jgi:hypothetical protein
VKFLFPKPFKITGILKAILEICAQSDETLSVLCGYLFSCMLLVFFELLWCLFRLIQIMIITSHMQ